MRVSAVPEPASFLLLTAGLAGLAIVRHCSLRRARKERLMIRCFLFIALSAVFGSQLAADSLPTLTATSGSASWVPDSVSFSITGPSFDISGSAFYFGPAAFMFLPVGKPLSQTPFSSPLFLMETFGRPIHPSGKVTVGGKTYGVEYSGSGSVTYAADTLVPAANIRLTLPATLTGRYQACINFNPSDLFPCEFAPPSDFIANISIDLTGVLSLAFSTFSPTPFPFAPNGTIDLDSITFSTIPEPSSAVLMALGAAALATIATQRTKLRRRRPAD
jgi:PEP-CTERM motif